jgi:hypothetical protein
MTSSHWDLIHKGCNVELLEDIVCSKICPKNLEQGIALVTKKQKVDCQAAQAKDLKQKEGIK